jgi:outer membrane protein assembly factor BamB
VPAGAGVVGLAALALWLSAGEAPAVTPRLPGQTASLGLSTPTTSSVERNTGTLISGSGQPSSLEGSWPQFRGADRSNVVWDATGLARTWPADGPRVLWRLPVGEGHAGAVINKGRVYVVDYDREKKEDAIRCLSLDDASELWRYTYFDPVKRTHGMSRTVPAVTDDYLVALGPKCQVHALNAVTGELLWKMDLVEQYGTEVPPWYAGQCPLIDGSRVILAPGGDPLMMAVDLATGEILWRTPNPDGWGMTHSSIVAMDYNGTREYVYCTTQGVVSVSADDGHVLWRKPDWKIPLANVPTPVVVGEDRIFFSGGYQAGCAMVRLTGAGDSPQVEELWRLPYTDFGSDQQTPIFYKGYIYGVAPGGELVCLGLEGNVQWRSGANHRFELGPYILADGLLFVLGGQSGVLHMIEASPESYQELAQAPVVDGLDVWGPMAMAADRLILRNADEMVCLEVPKG